MPIHGQAEAPLTGVIEVRLHGVGGAAPANLLGDTEVRQVAGDGLAGFFRGGGRRTARNVEAYCWGGLTWGGPVRVLWLLLLPFMTANVAGWMCPEELRGSPRWFAVYRWAARVAALATTVSAVALLAIIPVDVLAYQCGAISGCAGNLLFERLGDHVVAYPGRRIALGAAPVLLAIAVLVVIGTVSRNRYENVRPPRRVGDVRGRSRTSAAALREGLADPDFWDGAVYARHLTLVHVAAALAVVAVLVAHTAGEAAPTPAGHGWLRTAALGSGLLVPSLGVLALTRDKVGGFAERAAWGLLAGSVLSLAAAVVFAAGQARSVPGEGMVGELPGVALFTAVVCAVVAGAVILVGAVLGAFRLAVRPVSRGSRRPFRWAAPFVGLALSAAMANIVPVGLLLSAADVVGEICFPDPGPMCGNKRAIAVLPVFRGVTPLLILAPVAVTLGFAVWQAVRWVAAGRKEQEEENVRKEYLTWEECNPVPHDPNGWRVSTVSRGPEPADWQRAEARRWARGVARFRRLAVAPLDVDLLLTLMVVVGGALLVWQQVRMLLGLEPEFLPRWLITWCIGIVLLLPVVTASLLWMGWRDPRKRRPVGVVWDVGTFWPRAYHPLAPPSYAERAVPEVQRRIWRLHDAGGAALIVAHSQGSVLGAAALVQESARPRCGRVALITLGSPLRKLYRWGFPAYFTEDLLLSVGGPKTPLFGRRNIYVETDYIGGEIWPETDGTCGKAKSGGVDGGEVPPETGGRRGKAGPEEGDPCGQAEPETWDRRAKVELKLPDPATSRFIYGEALPRITSHTGYWDDPRVRREVDMLAKRFAAHLGRRPPAPDGCPECSASSHSPGGPCGTAARSAEPVLGTDSAT